MHSLLARQLRRHQLAGAIPPALGAFINAIDEAYKNFDADRVLADRSLEICSRELVERRREVEEALRRTESDYRSIFENATSGIFQTTPDGRYLKCNPALAHLYGYESPQELIHGVSDIQRQLYVEHDARQRFVELMAASGSVSAFEAR